SRQGRGRRPSAGRGAALAPHSTRARCWTDATRMGTMGEGEESVAVAGGARRSAGPRRPGPAGQSPAKDAGSAQQAAHHAAPGEVLLVPRPPSLKKLPPRKAPGRRVEGVGGRGRGAEDGGKTA
ncbi:hypothetical protein THAOC_14669, partial [Thalassiosira oceanica]